MSAIGSDVILYPPADSPARLNDAGNFTGQRQLPETDAAQREFPHVAARASAPLAAVALAASQLGRLRGLCLGQFHILGDLGCGCHLESLSTPVPASAFPASGP